MSSNWSEGSMYMIDGGYVLKIVGGNSVVYDIEGNEITRASGSSEKSRSKAVKALKELTDVQLSPENDPDSPQNNQPTESKGGEFMRSLFPLSGLEKPGNSSGSNLPFNPDYQNLPSTRTLEIARDQVVELLQRGLDLSSKESSRLQRFLRFSDAILIEALLTDRPAEEILREWHKNPDLVPGELGDMPDDTFVSLLRASKSTSSLEAIEKAKNEAQSGRSDVLGGLKDRIAGQESSDQTLNKALINHSPAFARVGEILTPEEQGQLSNDQLRMIEQQGRVDAWDADSQAYRDRAKGYIPENYSPDFTKIPTFDESIRLYEELINPPEGYRYRSDAPFNREEHNLAAYGHGKGSSSQKANDYQRAAKRSLEDEERLSRQLDNMGRIQGITSNQQEGRRRDLQDIYSLYQGVSDSHQTGIETGNRVNESSAAGAADRQFKNNVFMKDVAEGEISNINTALQEDVGLETEKANLAMQQQADMEGIRNDILNFESLFSKYGQDIANAPAIYQQAAQNLWGEREKIYAIMQNRLSQEQADQLRASMNDSNQFIQTLGKLLQYGGAAALFASGQPLAGATLLGQGATDTYNAIDPNSWKIPGSNWFGNSATTSNRGD